MNCGQRWPLSPRVQKASGISLDMLGRIPGLQTMLLESHCCGMAGTWGMAADNFDTSQQLGRHLIKLFDRSQAATGVTDCPTCRIQMEQVGDKPVVHPVEILSKALG